MILIITKNLNYNCISWSTKEVNVSFLFIQTRGRHSRSSNLCYDLENPQLLSIHEQGCLGSGLNVPHLLNIQKVDLGVPLLLNIHMTSTCCNHHLKTRERKRFCSVIKLYKQCQMRRLTSILYIQILTVLISASYDTIHHTQRARGVK